MTLAIPSGIDLSHIDADARPQDDLFGHVNGRWLAEHEIPADRATDGAFRSLFDRAETQVRDLIIQASQAGAAVGTDAQRIGDLYASYLDEEAVERAGVQPLHDELATIDSAADATELAAALGTLQRAGVGGGIGVYVDTDSKDSTRYLVHFTQSGIGLPDESYYRDEQHAAVLAAYLGHIARMFGLVYGGESRDHAKTADRIVALETKLADAHWDVVKRRDADLGYNLRTFAQLQTEGAGFDWVSWVTALGSAPDAMTELVVRQPDYLVTFASLWASVNVEDWKCWARWRLIRARAPWLTRALVAEDFEFYGRTLTGAQQLRDRWKRGVSLVENLMGDAVGKLYVQRHFPPDAKSRIDTLVDNLQEAYRISISELDWMTP